MPRIHSNSSVKRKWIKIGIYALVALLVLMNAIAYLHAYKFTHFSESRLEKTKHPRELTTLEKVKTLMLGVNNPRPQNNVTPTHRFETVLLNGKTQIECWSITTENPTGTVALFHGYSGQKSLMLDKADVFLKLGYNVLLVDFMGSGGSSGNQTTIGFFEAEQVKRCFDYLSKNKAEHKIYLFGTSMGAVAIMKALNDYKINPRGIILECPFGSMYETVCARFRSMNAPVFPMAALLVFWGGLQNGFWAFGHNPSEYAKSIQCSTLLLYGARDERVSRNEINTIFKNLKGQKHLKVYPEAAHENYLKKYEAEWTLHIGEFLNKQ